MRFVGTIERIPPASAPSPPPPGPDVVALGANESPYPPFPSVQQAIADAASELNRYPDPSATALRTALSAHHGMPADQIAVGNGSVDLLLAAAQALLGPGRDLVYAWPSFSAYRMLAALTGARAVEVPLDPAHRHDLDAIASAVTADTALVIVCNPNNPTSTAVSNDELDAFLRKLPSETCVILDEAYCEFNAMDDPSASLRLLNKHPNLVLLRTFSKVYGLSGLRMGYALAGDGEMVVALDKVRQPFGCNSLGQLAAIAALEDADALSERIDRNAQSRTDLLRELRSLGLCPAVAQANFAWFATHLDSIVLTRALRDSNIFVMPGAPFGAPKHLRVTFGTPEENARLIDVLRKVIARDGDTDDA